VRIRTNVLRNDELEPIPSTGGSDTLALLGGETNRSPSRSPT